MFKRFLQSIIAAVFLFPALSFAQQSWISFTGDSITRRTGGCTAAEGYAGCDQREGIPHDQSYATYVWISSRFQLMPVYNSGRGGDTCEDTGPWSTDGIYTGNRGLINRMGTTVLNRGGDTVAILIGGNDVLLYNRPVLNTVYCMANLWWQAKAAGKKVIVVTYPPISTTRTIFPAYLNNPAGAAAKLAELNVYIRWLVNEYGGPANQLYLADLGNAYGGQSPDLYTVDGVHPTAAGAKLMARTFFNSLCAGGNLPTCTNQ